MTLTRASLSEPLSQGSLDFLYRFTTLVCNPEQPGQFGFPLVFYFKQKAEKSCCNLLSFGPEGQGYVPWFTPSCASVPTFVWNGPFPHSVTHPASSLGCLQVNGLLIAPMRASCLHFLLSLCKFLVFNFCLSCCLEGYNYRSARLGHRLWVYLAFAGWRRIIFHYQSVE